jgi:hypothetical protein
MVALLTIIPMGRVTAGSTAYLLSHLGRPALASSSTRTVGRSSPQQLLFNANSLLRMAGRRRGSITTSSAAHLLLLTAQRRCRLLSTRRYVLDFFDPLEPFEMAWEFYCKRYEIMDELLGRLLQATKRHSFRALVAFGGAFVVGELLARVGVLGERGEGLVDYLKESERFNEGSRERFYQKTSSWMLDAGIGALRRFRRFGSKSKFAISVSAGVFFGRAVISVTTFCVRSLLISFFVMETLSFLGVIGEMGESILDWVEDERDRQASWTKSFAKWHKVARKKLSFEWLEELYEAAVDEEKIASFGFSVGTVFALVT